MWVTYASWLRVTVRVLLQPLVCMFARGLSLFFFLIMADVTGSLAELVESMEWDGKDGTFVTGIMSIFTLNDITVSACWYHLGLPDQCFSDVLFRRSLATSAMRRLRLLFGRLTRAAARKPS